MYKREAQAEDDDEVHSSESEETVKEKLYEAFKKNKGKLTKKQSSTSPRGSTQHRSSPRSTQHSSSSRQSRPSRTSPRLAHRSATTTSKKARKTPEMSDKSGARSHKTLRLTKPEGEKSKREKTVSLKSK